MGGKLQIEIGQQDGPPDVHVVRVAGFLDAATFRELSQRAAPLAQRDKPLIAIDLGGLEYLGSAGVAALMDIVYSAQDREGEVALASPPQKIRDVLRTLGLADVLSIHDSMELAVGALQQGKTSLSAKIRSESGASTGSFGRRKVEFVGPGGATEPAASSFDATGSTAASVAGGGTYAAVGAPVSGLPPRDALAAQLAGLDALLKFAEDSRRSLDQLEVSVRAARDALARLSDRPSEGGS